MICVPNLTLSSFSRVCVKDKQSFAFIILVRLHRYRSFKRTNFNFDLSKVCGALSRPKNDYHAQSCSIALLPSFSRNSIGFFLD